MANLFDTFNHVETERLRAAGWRLLPGLLMGTQMWQSPDGDNMIQQEAIKALDRLDRAKKQGGKGDGR